MTVGDDVNGTDTSLTGIDRAVANIHVVSNAT